MDYGRLNADGEVRLAESTSQQCGKMKQRHVFIFDKVLIICKANRVGYSQFYLRFACLHITCVFRITRIRTKLPILCPNCTQVLTIRCRMERWGRFLGQFIAYAAHETYSSSFIQKNYLHQPTSVVFGARGTCLLTGFSSTFNSCVQGFAAKGEVAASFRTGSVRASYYAFLSLETPEQMLYEKGSR